MVRTRRQSHLGDIILILMLFIGLALLLYPSFSDYWNSFHQTRVIGSYIERVAHIDNTSYDEILSSAQRYNENLKSGGFRWFLADEEKEAYEAELNINDFGQMGYITIDKINTLLPVYHGTNESVLQSAIGHIEWSSLPVGGEGTHTVLSGHRGLPSARLFTDLDKMKVGDGFILSVLNEVLTYEVDQIRIVEPTDLSELQIVPGKDYCTLVTCTPYGINSHRLLIRGHRVETQISAAQVRVIAEARQIDPEKVAPIIGFPILVIMFLLFAHKPSRSQFP